MPKSESLGKRKAGNDRDETSAIPLNPALRNVGEVDKIVNLLQSIIDNTQGIDRLLEGAWSADLMYDWNSVMESGFSFDNVDNKNEFLCGLPRHIAMKIAKITVEMASIVVEAACIAKQVKANLEPKQIDGIPIAKSTGLPDRRYSKDGHHGGRGSSAVVLSPDSNPSYVTEIKVEALSRYILMLPPPKQIDGSSGGSSAVTL